jgi:hypothetical protein
MANGTDLDGVEAGAREKERKEQLRCRKQEGAGFGSTPF